MTDCLFCRLAESGDHVHAADGFVAIRDIAHRVVRFANGEIAAVEVNATRKAASEVSW